MKQTKRKAKRAAATHIEWHVSDKLAANSIRDALQNEGIGDHLIKVIHTPK